MGRWPARSSATAQACRCRQGRPALGAVVWAAGTSGLGALLGVPGAGVALVSGWVLAAGEAWVAALRARRAVRGRPPH
ncbi:MAG: hypothetical protein QOK40_2180 [Miltoncostaeaceae bacterium]|nr:hypothetical protein [Miltoncostaeaceae bacterium]